MNTVDSPRRFFAPVGDGVDELEELIADGWRCQAPRAVVDAFDRA